MVIDKELRRRIVDVRGVSVAWTGPRPTGPLVNYLHSSEQNGATQATEDRPTHIDGVPVEYKTFAEMFPGLATMFREQPQQAVQTTELTADRHPAETNMIHEARSEKKKWRKNR